MVFCNTDYIKEVAIVIAVTILILIDGFLQLENMKIYYYGLTVTILILIDGFLQL